MAVKNLQFVLSGTDKSAGSTFDKVGKKAGGLSGVMDKIGGSLPVVGAGIAIVAGGALKLGSSFIETSSRLEALGAKSKTVFGDQLTVVDKWAKANAGAMKLTRSEAIGLTTNMADLLIPMGFTRKSAAKMSTEMVGLSGALSKWSGGTVSSADAANILTDAMLGETDGLKALGISISAAEIDAELLRKGQQKLTGAAKAQAEAQATQALIFAKSTDAQKGFQSGTKTLADRMENLRVKMRSAWEQLVIKLTPAAERFADFVASKGAAALARFADYIQRNRDRFIQLGASALGAFAEISRGLGSLAFTFGKAMSTMLFGAAGVANALGKEGLANDLNKAAGEAYLMGVRAKEAGDLAGVAFDAAGRKLAAIKSKTVTISVDYQPVGGPTIASIERGYGSARQAPIVVQNRLTVDGRVLADSNAQVRTDRLRNGAVPVF